MQLIQYNYTIHSASLSFTWENVYAYDRDFRMHISRHPERSWGVILQQAWTMRLRDRVSYGKKFSTNNGGSGSNRRSGEGRNGNVCYKFNKGKCTYGFNCKFDHKCLICGKFGHGAHNCRKADRGSAQVKRKDNETGEFSYDKADRYDKFEKNDKNRKK